MATEQRAWRHRFGAVTVIPSHRSYVDGNRADEVLYPAVKGKLEHAIKLAPEMVSAALDALNEMELYKPEHAHRTDAKVLLRMQPDPNLTEAGQALLKYFNLRHSATDARYWACVKGIMEVYEKMYDGLSGAYELVIAQLDAKGRVRSHGTERTLRVSPIRATFGFSDEWGHTEYTWPERRGRIQVAIDYLGDRQVGPQDLARTIVHEASHKWAHTKDVLYKVASWAKVQPHLQAGLSAVGVQPERHARPDRTKALVPMAGLDNLDKASRPIARERWLENADSYAWMARRLWKRAG